MAVPARARSADVTVASWGRAVPGVTHERPPAVCRRCKGGSGQPGDARYPWALAPARRGPPVTSPARSRYFMRDHAPGGARRAPRALDASKETPHPRVSRQVCAVPVDA
jgi:hypothetical protein